MYLQSYHNALHELIHYGTGHPDRATNARRMIARALRELRRSKGHARARRERRHMLFVSSFPEKQ
jgi:hypothetical protein